MAGGKERGGPTTSVPVFVAIDGHRLIRAYDKGNEGVLVSLSAAANLLKPLDRETAINLLRQQGLIAASISRVDGTPPGKGTHTLLPLEQVLSTRQRFCCTPGA